MGVSGGGGEPRVALVVEVEAVEANLFIALEFTSSSGVDGIGGG